jgi:glycosyltransferase involved in cell wall biosynthesis
MRILMLAQFYPPIIGGEEQHVRNLSHALAARGHEVAVATLWHDGLPEFEEDGGVRIYRVRALAQRLTWLFSETGRRHAPPWADPETTRALREVIAREQPQIVHAHNWLVHSFTPLKRESGAKLVLTLHDYSLVCVKKNLMRQVAEVCTGPEVAKCLRCAVEHYGAVKGIPTVTIAARSSALERRTVDMFLPVSRAVAEGNQLAEQTLPHQVIPNFIPDDLAERRAPDDPHLADLPAGEFILYVGDLSPQKGGEVLLSAYAELTDAPPLVMIGRPFGPPRENLPPGVTILHSWPHEAVMAAWQRSLMGIVPSIWPDPCPTVAMEAMVAGRPVIAANTGGLIDIVADGTTGLLVPPGDVTALRDAIARLLMDATMRANMGAAARQRVRLFQAGTVVPTIEQVYQSLL